MQNPKELDDSVKIKKMSNNKNIMFIYRLLNINNI